MPCRKDGQGLCPPARDRQSSEAQGCNWAASKTAGHCWRSQDQAIGGASAPGKIRLSSVSCLDRLHVWGRLSAMSMRLQPAQRIRQRYPCSFRDRRSGILASVVTTGRLNGVEPQASLIDVLERMMRAGGYRCWKAAEEQRRVWGWVRP